MLQPSSSIKTSHPVIATLLLALLFTHPAGAEENVTAVPEAVRSQLKLSHFYRKYLDAGGFPIVASDKVSDHALREARYLINQMLVGREDIRQSLIQLRYRCAIMAFNEFTTDLPEHSDLTPADFWDRRARGLGPTKTRPIVSCGEENVLQFPGDHYQGENILIHEFAHAIHEAIREIDPTFDTRLEEIYQQALKDGLWKDKYAASNRYEYWGECVQSYFDDNQQPNASHNHVNTREELFEYDPRFAKFIDETFKTNTWRYQPIGQRKDPLHLAGWDRAGIPTFVWPAHLEETRKRRERRSGSSIEHVIQNIEGWKVETDIQLLEGFDEAFGREALRVLADKLREITLLVPPARLKQLQQITLFIDREHPGLSSMQYHPSKEWLSDHGYDVDMARAVHIPRARELVTLLTVNQQPSVILHELAHAYHDQFLDFDEPRIRAAWEKFRKSGKYDQVLDISGNLRPHYALTDHKEFFAEMTESFFGVNDFYPFVRGELKRDEPELFELLGDIWGKERHAD